MSTDLTTTDPFALLAQMVATMTSPPVDPELGVILPYDVRRLMHGIGWDELHVSQVTKGRWCPFDLSLSLQGHKSKSGINYLLGSLFHYGMEDVENTDAFGGNTDYWYTLAQEIFRRHPKTQYLNTNGGALRDHELVDICKAFASGGALGIPMRAIVVKLAERLIRYGLTNIEAELNIRYQDGADDRFPIMFDSTIDIAARLAGQRVLIDSKSSGLWGPLLGHGGVQKQSATMLEIQHHAQLRHYSFMLSLVHADPGAWYGLAFPANLVPYKKGPDVGKDRGVPIVMAPVLGQDIAAQTRFELQRTIASWLRHGFYRAYPSTYGTSACPTCQHFEVCANDRTSHYYETDVAKDLISDYMSDLAKAEAEYKLRQD